MHKIEKEKGKRVEKDGSANHVEKMRGMVKDKRNRWNVTQTESG